MGDPILDNGEVIMINPTEEFADYWATLIEAKSGSSSFDIKDATFEINLFEDSSIFTKGSKGNKREIKRRIKTILNNSTFPEEQKRKAAEYYAQNPEYMHLPIDKMDPRKLFLFDVIDESFVCVNDLESKGMLKPVKDVELDWSTFKMFKELNFISRQEKVLDREIAEDSTKRISSRKTRRRPPPNLVKREILKKGDEDDDDYHLDREKDLATERKRRESEIERKRREREQDFELQQERLYEIFKKSQQKKEQELQIKSQPPIKEIKNFGAQNPKPEHSQNRSESSYEIHKTSSLDKKERERERKRDQSPESPHHHKSRRRDKSPESPRHHKSIRRDQSPASSHRNKSKRRHRDRSSSSERSMFSPSSLEERSAPKHQFSSKKSHEKTRTSSPSTRGNNENDPRAQLATSKKPKQDEEIQFFSDDSEQSQGRSLPFIKKKMNPLQQLVRSAKRTRRNSSHLNPSSLESIPEEAHPDSDGLEIVEIIEEDHEEISQLIEEQINQSKAAKKGSGKESLEIVKIQEEVIIPSRRREICYDDEEHEEIAQLMEENIRKSRMIPSVAKIEEDYLSHYKKEMEELIKETIHHELQQMRIKKYQEEPVGEGFSTQSKTAMAQVIHNQGKSSPDIGIIEEENANEDIRDLAQLIEEQINKSKISHQSKKSDRAHEVHREKETNQNLGPLLMHDVIEDYSLDIYDPELAQLMEEKIHFSKDPSPQNEKGSLRDQDELERTQIIEEKSHSSRNSSPCQENHSPKEKPKTQKDQDNQQSLHHPERIQEYSPSRADIKGKNHHSKRSSSHNKKTAEDSHSHHKKLPAHPHRSEVIEDGEMIQEKTHQSKKSSQRDRSYDRSQRSRSHHKRSHPDRDRSSNRSVEKSRSGRSQEATRKGSHNKNDQKNHQDVKLNDNLEVGCGNSTFTSEIKASTKQTRYHGLHHNKNLINLSQENSEILIIEGEKDKENEEQFNLVNFFISDHGKGDFDGSEVEEIDISEIKTQDLNQKSPDSHQKDTPKIVTLETVRLPPKEHHSKNMRNSEPAPKAESNSSANPTPVQQNKPIEPRTGNLFGGPFIGPAPFQCYPPVYFPALNETFRPFIQQQFIPSGPRGAFPGNFMAPSQMQPPNQFMPSKDKSKKNPETEKQENKHTSRGN